MASNFKPKSPPGIRAATLRLFAFPRSIFPRQPVVTPPKFAPGRLLLPSVILLVFWERSPPELSTRLDLCEVLARGIGFSRMSASRPEIPPAAYRRAGARHRHQLHGRGPT